MPYQERENVTHIVLDLASELEVKLDNKDISIAQHLPQKKHSATNNDGSQKAAHPSIKARFVSRDKTNNYTKIASRRKTLMIFRLMV